MISARSILATRSRSSVAPGTRNVATDRKERLVHSTVSFLEAGRLRGGAPTIRAARLLVQPTPPPHFEEAMALQGDAQSSWTFKWRLVASVNVARGRDQKRQRQVRVKLPLAPVEGRVGTMKTNSLMFYLWDAAVPALPIIAQFLLAALMAVGGYRRYRRR